MSHKQQILIVTREFDPHADEMLLALRYLGQDTVRLNVEYIPTRSLFALAYDGTTWKNQIIVDGRPLNPEWIGAVWWRRPGVYQLPDDLSPVETQFAIEETHQAVRGFWGSMHCYWMSHPHAIATARSKPEQLYRAHQFSFALPRTLVTTNPTQAQSFYEACDGQVVFRVMSDPSLVVMDREINQSAQMTHATPATRLTPEHITMLDSICLVPCMFQEALPLKHRIYVVIIEDRLFAVEAHIQMVDGIEQEVSFASITLPDAIAQSCLEYVHSYDLQFGVLTLAQTTTDKLLFVDLDPTGQFMWIQHEVPTLQLIETLAQTLIEQVQH